MRKTENILTQYQVIDLTHEIHSGIPGWEDGCGFHIKQMKDYADGCKTQFYEMRAGIGTHIDAPAHFVKGGKDIASLSLENLLVPARVIDVSLKADQDYFITSDDILNHEKNHGKIGNNTLIIGYTGWYRYWNDPKLYRNLDKNGAMHFPGFSKESVEILLERQIAGIGIDTLSPDGSNTDFPVHHLTLTAGMYLIENMTNLSELPAKGGYVLALPLKIRDGTESPLRIVGLAPR